MTEQEEATGRQRLQVLDAYRKKLIVFETNRDILHPDGGEHASAVKDYDRVAAMVERLEADPLIPQVRLLDAELLVTTATEGLAAAQVALATYQAVADDAAVNAVAELTARQTAIDDAAVKAGAELTARQTAIDDAQVAVSDARAALAALQMP